MQGWTRFVIALLVGFCAGAITDAWVTHRLPAFRGRSSSSRLAHPAAAAVRPLPPHPLPQPRGTSGGLIPMLPETTEDPITVLRRRNLAEPIEGAEVERWKGSFAEARTGHQHEAVDIMAPRGTPIHAVDDGTIARLFRSKAGGNTIYEYDPSGRFVYYYAHLERYDEALRDGAVVHRGQVIGQVGSSGDASPDAPHLHFAINVLHGGERWWQGTPIDPYLVFRP